MKITFKNAKSPIIAVDDVSFALKKGKTLGIVGESGSGKSILALSILGLLPKIAETSGEILYKKQNILNFKEKDLRKIRGSEIAIIFQDPASSLDPIMTVGKQIEEIIRLHQKLTKKEAKTKAIEMLKIVKIPDAERRFGEYPHELSGGMRQRVMIAMALSCNPKILICDEPTTALDVTTQAKILALINDLKIKFGMSVIMITHDLGVIFETADDVLVMKTGKIVEHSDAKEIFLEPKSNYTRELLDALPMIRKII